MSEFLGPIEAAIARRRKRGLPVARLHDIELSEISCVTVPANEGARHLLHKHLHEAPDPMPALLPVPSHIIAAMVAAELAKATARLEASHARTDATATRMEAQAVTKAADPVADAVAEAKARQAHPPAYWQGAIRALGQSLAPDASPAEQRDAALRDARGKALVQALTADYRNLPA